MLYDRLAGTFTWLPSVGADIGRGGVLFRLDNLPVVLMYGSVPAYRALKPGVSEGPDVAELNQNLIALGYDPYGAITDPDAYSEATAAAVRRWQHAEGLSETGRVELGRIVFAPSAQRVSALKVTLGQDPPPAASPATASPPAEAGNEPASGKHETPKSDKHEPSKKKKRKKKHEPHKGDVTPKSSGTPNREKAAANRRKPGRGRGRGGASDDLAEQIVELEGEAGTATSRPSRRAGPCTASRRSKGAGADHRRGHGRERARFRTLNRGEGERVNRRSR